MALSDLVIYLSRNRQDYKSGLPAYSTMRADDRILFVYKDQSEEDTEFLHGLSEKGFKIDPDKQLYCDLSKSNNSLAELIKENSIRFVIVFGNNILSESEQKVLYSQSAPVVTADNIEKIRTDQNHKKSLWSSIKDL